MNARPLNSKHLYSLIFIGCVLFALLKLSFLPFGDNTDFHTYVETAKLISGEEVSETFGFRILKPASPASVAFLAMGGHLMTYETAFYAVVIIFYGLLGIALYKLYRKIAEDISASSGTSARALTWIPWLALMTSYPLVRYGLDSYLETGAWFLYVLGLYTTYLFYKQPTMRLALMNSAIFCIGFFWKEYSAINVLIFAVIVLTVQIPWKFRIHYALVSGALFLSVNLLLQWFIYARFGYTYLDWLSIGAGGYATEYTALNLTKSLGALLLAGWILVPVGLYHLYKKEGRLLKIFISTAIACSALFLMWGYVSSRLYFVAAPMLAFVAGYGIIRITSSRRIRIIMTAFVIGFQIAAAFLMSA